MLGEKVGAFTGTTTDKVLPAQGGFPTFETSAQTTGKLAGADVQSMATSVSYTHLTLPTSDLV